MDRCDVLIVGGGPAGSSCARALRSAGMDVVVLDKATFPRDKTCAGWITPAVVDLLELDIDDYRRKRVFQPISAFRTGLVGGATLETVHRHAVSYGIRRCEFDTWLLERAGARLRLGEPLRQLERVAGGWQVNGELRTPLIVGAGGHFCPVARHLGAAPGQHEIAVTAKESEFALDAAQRAACRCAPGVPELYFCRDLSGYGWCLRKGDFINIGLGREGGRRLTRELEAFVEFLVSAGRIPPGLAPRYHGHAYLLYPRATRPLSGDGVLLVGDAAGLAYPQSGEGIRPAIESGLLAAATILQADGDYANRALRAYPDGLQSRYGRRQPRRRAALLPAALRQRLARSLLGNRWFARHVLLERWFLHAHEPPLQV